ncbi:hypothetical protein H6P81_010218 [Aristolochia fimbriata]|uniref:Uncharacterized protein n=1 Tax=Aristolochia fimbriata TaxID=158543 RepID=A0AAV7ENE0_ARIFI|nr:hypothetical protein H6P81_010218 [Aristolochia fimbriata]
MSNGCSPHTDAKDQSPLPTREIFHTAIRNGGDGDGIDPQSFPNEQGTKVAGKSYFYPSPYIVFHGVSSFGPAASAHHIRPSRPIHLPSPRPETHRVESLAPPTTPLLRTFPVEQSPVSRLPHRPSEILRLQATGKTAEREEAGNQTELPESPQEHYEQGRRHESVGLPRLSPGSLLFVQSEDAHLPVLVGAGRGEGNRRKGVLSAPVADRHTAARRGAGAPPIVPAAFSSIKETRHIFRRALAGRFGFARSLRKRRSEEFLQPGRCHEEETGSSTQKLW